MMHKKIVYYQSDTYENWAPRIVKDGVRSEACQHA